MIGLLEQHELTARRRIDELREEADRIQVDHIQAERAAAEQEGQKRAVSRRRAGTVLGPDSGTAADIAGNQTVRLPPTGTRTALVRRGPWATIQWGTEDAVRLPTFRVDGLTDLPGTVREFNGQGR